jgi:hypothetical protein
MHYAGIADQRGIWAFILGMLAVLLTCKPLPGRKENRPGRTFGIAVKCMLIGLTVGLVLFAIWYWQSYAIERAELLGFYLAVLVGFGLFAGAVVTLVMLAFMAQSRSVAKPIAVADGGRDAEPVRLGEVSREQK